MPLYDFKCVKCESKWTEAWSISEYSSKYEVVCEQCKEVQDKRQARELSTGIEKIVKGVSKGYYGRG